jgi:ABC-type lipopolysaccharide export system ATPase subunit
MISVSNLSKEFGERVLFEDASFQLNPGSRYGLVGANGSGKTTLLRIIAGDVEPASGAVTRSGGLGVMRQFVSRAWAGGEAPVNVRDLLLSVAPPRARAAATALDTAEIAMMEADDEKTQMAYAAALAEWADAGGYEAEVLWDVCTTAALGIPYERCRWRAVDSLSGGEQKRLVLEALLRGPDEVLLLDEPFAGIDPIAVTDIQKIIFHLKSRGIGVLITDHNVRETLSLIDRAYIIYDGQVLTQGNPAEIIANEDVRRVYLGDMFG